VSRSAQEGLPDSQTSELGKVNELGWEAGRLSGGFQKPQQRLAFSGSFVGSRSSSSVFGYCE
jgi:hypothetical protein